MTEQQLIENINQFFAGRGKPVPSKDCDIFETGLIDSMELLELIMYMEERFNLELDQDLMTVDNFRSVAKIAQTFRSDRS